jgi:hypothetical protein
MDALKRAVDLMDESAVKLSSARGRYVIRHITSHLQPQSVTADHIDQATFSGFDGIYKAAPQLLILFMNVSMVLSLSIAESQGRTAIYYARNASVATAISLLYSPHLHSSLLMSFED